MNLEVGPDVWTGPDNYKIGLHVTVSECLYETEWKLERKRRPAGSSIFGRFRLHIQNQKKEKKRQSGNWRTRVWSICYFDSIFVVCCSYSNLFMAFEKAMYC